MSESKIPISVLIIAQNAEKFVKRCLDSLVDFDEVVFVDGGSTDRTLELARVYSNVKIYENPWPGFVPQRNFSVGKASHPWSFMIDIDEAATPELVKAMAEVINSKKTNVIYSVMRTEYFEGVAIEEGFGKSSYQERLFQTKRVTYSGGVHHRHMIDGHEDSWNSGKISFLPEELRVLHNPDYNFDQMIQKLPRFSILIAHEKFKFGRRASAAEVFITFPLIFIRNYRKSFRNGYRGFLLCMLEAVHATLVKLYIYYLGKNSHKEDLSKFESKNLG